MTPFLFFLDISFILLCWLSTHGSQLLVPQLLLFTMGFMSVYQLGRAGQENGGWGNLQPRHRKPIFRFVLKNGLFNVHFNVAPTDSNPVPLIKTQTSLPLCHGGDYHKFYQCVFWNVPCYDGMKISSTSIQWWRHQPVLLYDGLYLTYYESDFDETWWKSLNLGPINCIEIS